MGGSWGGRAAGASAGWGLPGGGPGPRVAGAAAGGGGARGARGEEGAGGGEASGVMVVGRGGGGWADRGFAELPELLRAGDCLVANRSRVMPARLLGVAEPGGQAVELLLIRPVGDERWEAM